MGDRANQGGGPGRAGFLRQPLESPLRILWKFRWQVVYAG